METHLKKEQYQNVLDSVKSKMENGEQERPQVFSIPAPKSNLPKDMTKLETQPFNILDWDSAEIARQFCLIDYDIKKKWDHHDFYSILKSENSEKREEFTKRHLTVSKWVISIILLEEDSSVRAKIIVKLLDICQVRIVCKLTH